MCTCHFHPILTIRLFVLYDYQFTGRTVLFHAAVINKIRIAKILLDKGANIDATDNVSEISDYDYCLIMRLNKNKFIKTI